MLSPLTLNTHNTTTMQKPKKMNRPQAFTGTQNTESNSVAFTGLGSFIAHPMLSLTALHKLPTQELKEAYIEVNKAADSQGKADLDFLLNTGKLLSKDADDGSTTLKNLARILREPRVAGLAPQVVLNDTLRALANPYSITQDFGKITPEVAVAVMNNPEYSKMQQVMKLNAPQQPAFQAAPQQVQQTGQVNLPAEYNVDASGTCVAASMEFNLADKRPAEFARYAAELSSPKMSVQENFKFSDIDNDILASMYWLDQFNVEYDANNFTEGKINLRPDDAAIFRAVSQSQNALKSKVNNTQALHTRSVVDVLMQSTFMQLGSARSYNSLNDIRTGGFNQSDRGLTEFEKSMAEAVIDDKGGKSSVTYQIVDDNAFLVGYDKNYEQTLMDIVNSLKAGFNVIVGITETDENAKITGGHEITIVGSKIGTDGKLYFICNDTDDNISTPIEMSAQELIPKVHHAGIPNVVLNMNKQPVVQRPIIIEKPPVINQPAQTMLTRAAAFEGKVNTQEPVKKINLVA